MRSPQASILTLLEMYKDDPDGMPTAKLDRSHWPLCTSHTESCDDFLRLAKAERATAKDFEPLDLAESSERVKSMVERNGQEDSH